MRVGSVTREHAAAAAVETSRSKVSDSKGIYARLGLVSSLVVAWMDGYGQIVLRSS